MMEQSQSTEAHATPRQTGSRFFVAGGTLRHDAPSYVERHADRALHEFLLRGEFCYILTSRQMGKSSLMVRATARLRTEGFAIAVLDLTAIGQNLTASQWYGGLLLRLGQQLGLEDEMEKFWSQQGQLSSLHRFMVALQEIVLPAVRRRPISRNTPSSSSLVIFIDEIDVVRSLPFSTDEFFAAIRECYNRRSEDPVFARLTFCLLGVASPSDLISDTRTTPFNIGQQIELTDFTEEEAIPLAQGLHGREPGNGKNGERSAHALLKRILHWTGGHPYLTQRLCRAVAELAPSPTLRHCRSAVDQLCEELFLTPRSRERDDNLLFVRERMLRNETDPAALLNLYTQVCDGKHIKDDEGNPLISILRLSGIVRTMKGHLSVRNRIYARVFDRAWARANMPDAEVRRQRAAFRLGLVRASLVAGIIMAAMAILSLAAVREKDLAERALWKAKLNAHARERVTDRLRLSLKAEEAARRRADSEALRAEGESRRATRETGVANAARLAAESSQRQSERSAHRARTAEALARSEGSRTRSYLYFANMNLAQQAWQKNNLDTLRHLLAETKDFPERGFEWGYWQRLYHLPLATCLGHTAPVRAVAFSPDGKRVATASDDRTAKVWDAVTGRALLTLKGHQSPVASVAFSPNGRCLVTCGDDSRVKTWDASTGRELFTRSPPFPHGCYISSLAFSPGGDLLVTAGDWVRIWKADSGNQVISFRASPSDRLWNTLVTFSPSDRPWSTSVAFSPTEDRVLTGHEDHNGRIWDSIGGHEIRILKGHTGRVTSVAFSPDGKRILTGSDDHTAKVWDSDSGREIFTLTGHAGPVTAVSYSAKGRRIATASRDRSAIVWDATSGQERLVLQGHESDVTSIAFSPDGRRVVTGSWDRTARVWDAVMEREYLALTGHADRVWSVAFSSDGRHIATGSKDGTLRIWDAFNRILARRTLAGHRGPVFSVAFSPTGKYLVSGSEDCTAIVWEVATGRQILTLRGHLRSIHSVAVSPDGSRILTGSSDTTAKLWDAATGRPLLTLRGHRNGVSSVAFSPDGRRIATGSWDRTARVWDAFTGRKTLNLWGHLSGVISVAFSPDGKRLATGSDDTTSRIWNTATGAEMRVLRGHADGVTSVAFMPGGKRLVTGSWDDTARLWDVETGRETLALIGHASGVTSVACSLDGRSIVTGSDDKTAIVWEAAPYGPHTPKIFVMEVSGNANQN